MSKLPLASIFSAAHVSKWDALSKENLARATESGHEQETMTRPSVDDQSSDADHTYTLSGWSKPSGGVLSTRECEIVTVRAMSDVCMDPLGPTKSRAENMAAKTYTWVSLWFLLTMPVILWDATYCFMRPRSMVGGDLHWFWEPYGLYEKVDYVYGMKALEENDGFTNAQSLLNVVETCVNVAYLYLAHVSGWSGAPLVGFTGVTMTLSKTVLYWAQEYYCGGCSVGHNSWGTLLLLWVAPNGLWIIFPAMIMWRLGSDIASSLTVASQSARKAASGKMQ